MDTLRFVLILLSMLLFGVSVILTLYLLRLRRTIRQIGGATADTTNAGEKEYYYQNVLDNSSHYIIRTDLQGRYNFVNQAFLEAFIPIEERATIIGDPGLMHIIPEDHDKTTQIVQQCFQSPNTAFLIILRKKSLHGEIRTSEWSFVLLTDKTGNPSEFQCSGVDISDRLELEKITTAEYHRYDSLMNAINAIIWEADAQTFVFTYVSPAAGKILGYPAERWLQEPNFWKDHIHESDREEKVQFCLNATKTIQNHELEYRFIHQNGSTVWLRDIVTVEARDGKAYKIKGIMIDITREKEINRALYNTEQQFKSSVNALGEGIVLIDNNGVMVFSNERACEILGLTADQLIGRMTIDSRWRSIHEDGSEFPGIEYPAMITLQTGLPQRNVVMGVHKPDGALTWILINTQPVVYNQSPGSSSAPLLSVVASFTDITIQKQQEAELKLSKEQLQLALEGSMSGLWDWHVQTGETVFNERWAEIIGYTLEELQPVDINTWVKFCHPEDLEHSNSLLQAHFRKETPYYECEARMFHKSGSIVWVLDKGKVVEWTSEGLPARMTGAHFDITQRKQMEMELRKNEQRYRLLADNITDVISLHDPEGLFTFVSQSCKKVFGYTPEELIGINSYSLFHPDDAQRIRQESHNWVLEGDFTMITYRFLHKRGHYIWLESKSKPILSDEGSVVAIQVLSQDVSDRKFIEQDLSQTLQLLNETGSVAHIGGWEYFVETQRTRWTKESYKIFNQPENTVISFEDCTHYFFSDDQKILRDDFTKLSSDATEFDRDLRIGSIREKPVWVRAIGKALKDGSGKIVKLYGAFQNITPQKQFQSTILEQQQLISKILSVMPGAIYIVDTNDINNVYSSPGSEQLTGYSEHEMQSVDKAFYVSSFDPQDIKQAEDIAKFLHESPDGTIAEMTYRFLHKQGHWIWLLGKVIAFERHPVTRNITKFLGAVTDITGLKNAEQELTKANEDLKTMLLKLEEYSLELQSIITSMMDGLVLIDEDQSIELINPAVEQMFGYEDYELIGQPVKKLVPEHYHLNHDRAMSIFTDTTVKNKRYNNARGLKSDGLEFPMDVTMATFTVNDKRRILAIIRDITEQVQAQGEILELNKTLEFRVEERTKQLVELNNEKNEFLGIAAHDLKNPLAGIMTSVEVLANKLPHENIVQRYCSMVHAASEQMMDIITNLLDVNRIESGLMPIECRQLTLEFVVPIIEQYQQRAIQKGINLRYFFSDMFPSMIGNEQSVVQVLDNLLSNAIKFSPQWTTVTVRLYQTMNKNGVATVIIEVQDEGPGLNENDLQHLFTKFAKLSAKPTAGENSTGLGLSIVKKLVEMMNGKIWCESSPGKGATFIVEFLCYDSATVSA